MTRHRQNKCYETMNHKNDVQSRVSKINPLVVATEKLLSSTKLQIQIPLMQCSFQTVCSACELPVSMGFTVCLYYHFGGPNDEAEPVRVQWGGELKVARVVVFDEKRIHYDLRASGQQVAQCAGEITIRCL